MSQDVDAVAATGSCSSGGSLTEGLGGGLSLDDSPGDDEGAESISVCSSNLPYVTKALRIYGGLDVATDEDMDAYDRNVDEKIDWQDILTIIRSDCGLAVPKGWYTLQGNRRHTGRTSAPLPAPANMANLWTYSMSPAYADDGSTYFLPPIAPSLLAVPDSGSSSTLVYGVATDGHSTTTIYRIRAGSSAPGSGDVTTKTLPVSGSGISAFIASGTPLLYNGKLWVTGNTTSAAIDSRVDSFGYELNGTGYIYVLDATTLQLDTSITVNPIRLDGAAHGGVTYPAGTTYCSPVPDSVSGGVLITTNTVVTETVDGSELRVPKAYMFCMSASDGHPLWSVSSVTALPFYSRDDFDTEIPLPVSPDGSPMVLNGRAYTGDSTA